MKRLISLYMMLFLLFANMTFTSSVYASDETASDTNVFLGKTFEGTGLYNTGNAIFSPSNLTDDVYLTGVNRVGQLTVSSLTMQLDLGGYHELNSIVLHEVSSFNTSGNFYYKDKTLKVEMSVDSGNTWFTVKDSASLTRNQQEDNHYDGTNYGRSENTVQLDGYVGNAVRLTFNTSDATTTNMFFYEIQGFGRAIDCYENIALGKKVSATKKNLSEGVREWNLTDGNFSTRYNVMSDGWISGEKKVDVTVDLGGLKKVNSFGLNYIAQPTMSGMGYELYGVTADDEELMLASDASWISNVTLAKESAITVHFGSKELKKIRFNILQGTSESPWCQLQEIKIYGEMDLDTEPVFGPSCVVKTNTTGVTADNKNYVFNVALNTLGLEIEGKEKVKCLIAEYKDGSLRQLTMQDIDLGALKSYSITMANSPSMKGSNLKFFLLDDLTGLTPLSASHKISNWNLSANLILE